MTFPDWHQTLPVTRCEPCGKYAYASRKAARAHRRPADRLRAYRCPRNGELWHLGRLPQAIVCGLKTTHEVYGRPA